MIIRDDVLYEGVVSFKAKDNYYATPVGFTLRKGYVYLRVYHGSLTHLYLSSLDKIVLNIIEDPYIYLYLAFKKETNGLNKVKFVEVDERLPVIAGAKAYSILTLRSIEKALVYDVFKYIYSGFIVRDHIDEPFSRCRSLAIEALIYLTKMKSENLSCDEKAEAETYVDRVLKILNRICVDQYHEELINSLNKLYLKLRRT